MIILLYTFLLDTGYIYSHTIHCETIHRPSTVWWVKAGGPSYLMHFLDVHNTVRGDTWEIVGLVGAVGDPTFFKHPRKSMHYAKYV